MPRIPDEWIERLKTDVSVPLLAERAGVQLKKVGQELMGRCPFPPHDDSTPSLSINVARNVFQCFGCGAAGTSIDWVMREKGVDFREAVELLLREFFPSVAQALLGEANRQLTRRSRAPELPCPFDFTADDQRLLNEYADFCHALFNENAEPQDYARKRGLGSPELVSRFKLGYQDRTLGLRLPTKETKAGKEVRDRFEKLGLLRESGHGSFVGSLVIPTVDLSGNVTGIYARKTRDDLNKHSSPKHLYLKGPDRDVFNEEAFVASKEIILCESRIDALSFWRWGFRNVTACRGARNLSDALLEAFVKYGVERCFIAFDRDEAGDEGAAMAAGKLMAHGVECFRVLLPKGMDANEVTLKMQPADKTLGLFLRSAEWMGNGDHTSTRVTQAGREAAFMAAPSAAAEGPAEATEDESGRAAEKEKCSEPAPGADAPVCASAPWAAPSKKNGTHAPALDALAAPLLAGASPAPAPTSPLTKLTDDEAEFSFDDRRYRARGLKRCTGYGSLRLSLRAERISPELFVPPSPLEGWHLDTVDLCLHRQRAAFEKQAAHEMGVREDAVHQDLGRIVRVLEDVQERRISEAHAPKQKTVALSESETKEGLDFWRSPGLMNRIVDDFTTCGLVGEATNKLVTYIAACSRLLDRPLAIIIQSSSAAGKSSLMDALLRFMPEEMREKYTAVSGKSLFYFDEDTSLRHKILAIVEEEGAERATYPLKILQSEGELVMASTGKDPATGKLVTKTYRVEGPVMIILTTTSIDLDPELENRCLLLTVDESREHTRAIHELQRMRMTFEGYEKKAEKERLEKLHKNAQRLLRKINVYNPYARHLTFVDEQTRTRRDHAKYLTLIETIALVHQLQRPVYRRAVNGKEEEFVDVTLDDIELAGRLAGEILGKYLDDLKSQTRRFLTALDEMVTSLCETQGTTRSELRFTRRDILDLTGFSYEQVRVHMARLIELEYVLVHRGGRGQSFVFELLYNGEGKDGRPFVLGLVDVEKLRDTSTTPSLGWQEAGFGVPLGAHWGVIGVPLWGDESGLQPASEAAPGDSDAESAKDARLPAGREEPSYTADRRTPAPRLNLLRFPPQPKLPELGDERGDEHSDAPAATVTPIPKPHKRLPGGRSGRPLRRVFPDAVL